MAVKKLENGKWETRISYRDEDGKVRNKQKRFATRREAKEFEVEFLKGLKSLTDSSMTYDDLFEEYIEYSKQFANERTTKSKYTMADTFWSHFFDRKVVNISRKDYLDVWIKISESDYSISSKNKFVGLLKSVSKFGYIYRNYPDHAKTLERFKKHSLQHTDMNVWTYEELQQFLPNVENEMFKILFHFLFFTGLRIGEALALQRSDLTGDSISVTKTIKSFKQGAKPLKTASSRRKVELDDYTLSLIQGLTKGKGKYIFGGIEPVGQSTVQRAWDKAFETSKVKRIRIHDLRHSHASWLINSDVNIVAVSRRLGHSSVEMTLRVYTHLLEESNDKLMKVLNSKSPTKSPTI